MASQVEIEQVKDANPIKDVVGETLTLRGRGPRYRTAEHDSLEINEATGLWYWHSRGKGGDVFNWVMEQKRCDFGEALQLLARRAGIDLQVNGNAEQWAAHRARSDLLVVAAGYYHELLRATPRGLAYARGRGWSDETISAAMLGFWDGAGDQLRRRFAAQGHDPAGELAQVLLTMPAGTLIYPHVRGGRVQYVTTRSIEGKRHFNLPTAAAGPKRPYFNHCYSPGAGHVVIVEGQADAVTLAQWGLPAVALCGISADTQGHLGKALQRHDNLYLGLDADDSGRRGLRALAPELGPAARILTWPAGGDANDWMQAGGTSEECRELMAAAPMFVEWLADQVADAPPLERSDMRRDVARLCVQLDGMTYELIKGALASSLGVSVRTLNGLIKEAGKAKKGKDKDDRPVRQLIGTTTTTKDTAGFLFETVVEGEGAQMKTRLAVRTPEGEIKVMDRLELDDQIIEPLPATLATVRTKAVLLTPPPAPYESLQSLVDQIQRFLHRYVDLEPTFERISVFYALYTWLYDVFPRVPYLRRLGAAQSGKTRWLETMRALVFRAYYTSGSTSVASLYRNADQIRGTILMDEADFKDGTERAHDFNAIFNVGYGADYPGIERQKSQVDGGYEPAFFNVFGPKIITQRQEFSDDATNTRCLTDQAGGGGYTRDDIPKLIYPPDFWAAANAIRAQLLYYRMQLHPGDWHTRAKEAQPNPGLPARLEEITLPLQLLFHEEKELVKQIDALVISTAAALVAKNAQTLPARVLEGLLRCYFTPDPAVPEAERLTMKVLADRTNLIIDSENAGKTEEDDDDGDGPKRSRRRRKKLTPPGVSRIVDRDLHLATDYNKTRRLVSVVWDPVRIDALCRRFGLTELLAELAMAARSQESGAEPPPEPEPPPPLL